MSGQGKRFQAAGYTLPKPLIDVNGQAMVERLLSCFPNDWPATFVMAENHRPSGLPETLQRLRPGARQHFIPPHDRGPGEACRAALDGLPPDQPVLVSYCDYGMVWDAQQFERFVQATDCDACVVCYRGFHAHYLSPVTYAYCRMDGERVREVREKGSFTDQREQEFCSCGLYYFRSAKILRQALQWQEELGLELNGESYTSLTIEALLQKDPGADVRVFELDRFFQWGTPEQLQEFVYWERSFQSYLRRSRLRSQVEQVLMPMAGLGSRFQELFDTPKPFLSLQGVPMYQRALATLPLAPSGTLCVGLECFRDRVTCPESGWVWLEETPSGQALSTEAGALHLKAQLPVVVSSCDHGIVLDPQRWQRFLASSACDAAIFTVRGFPGVLRRPQAFAYVNLEAGDDSEFPVVESVSVKQPISAKPHRDPLLVGTFWFSRVELLLRGIERLKELDRRVNNELYLDSIFDVLREMGFVTRVIPLDGYLCWGDPDSLAESIYWHETFGAARFEPRGRFPGVR